nr:hypothetical protein [uncultured Gellertiella sp.]
MRLTCLLAAGILMTACAPETYKITVPANRSTTLGQVFSYSDNCHVVGRPVVKVTTQPQHGKVTFVWGQRKLGAGAKACKDVVGPTMQVIYTPDPGFHGKDYGALVMTYPKYEDSIGTAAASYAAEVLVK